jgi:hypothetical protein
MRTGGPASADAIKSPARSRWGGRLVTFGPDSKGRSARTNPGPTRVHLHDYQPHPTPGVPMRVPSHSGGRRGSHSARHPERPERPPPLFGVARGVPTPSALVRDVTHGGDSHVAHLPGRRAAVSGHSMRAFDLRSPGGSISVEGAVSSASNRTLWPDRVRRAALPIQGSDLAARRTPPTSASPPSFAARYGTRVSR